MGSRFERETKGRKDISKIFIGSMMIPWEWNEWEWNYTRERDDGECYLFCLKCNREKYFGNRIINDLRIVFGERERESVCMWRWIILFVSFETERNILETHYRIIEVIKV